jgi:hypothetical protein
MSFVDAFVYNIEKARTLLAFYKSNYLRDKELRGRKKWVMLIGDL